MDTSSTILRRFAKPAVPLLLALAIPISACSGGSEGSPPTSQDTGQTTPVAEETMMERTSSGSTSVEETTEQGSPTALSGGLEAARDSAKSWNEDAELYAIASLRPNMNVKGENGGWLYSFVSESEGSVLSLPYSGGEVRKVQAQELPPGQIERIASDTLSADELVDTPEAVQRSEEIRSYLEENPQAGGSAGVDSASGDGPEWILSVPTKGLQDRVSATK